MKNYCDLVEIDPKLIERMNDLCVEHNMGKIFFLTKAIENYCKNLVRKKKKEDK